jgi:predicted RNase H-like HicB family nuclease
MRCNVTITRDADRWVARCPEFPQVAGRGATRDEALARLRAEVTFWLEACPCDQTAAPGLDFTVVREAE